MRNRVVSYLDDTAVIRLEGAEDSDADSEHNGPAVDDEDGSLPDLEYAAIFDGEIVAHYLQSLREQMAHHVSEPFNPPVTRSLINEWMYDELLPHDSEVMVEYVTNRFMDELCAPERNRLPQ